MGPEGGRGLRTATLALVVAIAALAAGCGEKSEDVSPGNPQSFDVALDFYVNADHAGLYEAIDRGYFRDAGLDVHPQVPSDPSAPIKEVAAGRVDLAISYEPEVLLAHDQGLPVKAVAAVVPTPLTSLIWLKGSGIRGVKDLRGKTIATAGIPYQNAFLETILARANLKPDDVKAVNVGLNLLPAILGGRAQAMLGGFSNVEGVDLKLRHKDPTVTPVDQLGIPTYDELVFVAQASRLKDDSEPIRLFLAAMARGTAAAEKDPKGATQALLEQNHNLDPKLTAAEVKATLPVLSQGSLKRPYGYMNQAEWQQFIGWMRDHGLISSLPTPPQVLTEELLPGSIPG